MYTYSVFFVVKKAPEVGREKWKSDVADRGRIRGEEMGVDLVKIHYIHL